MAKHHISLPRGHGPLLGSRQKTRFDSWRGSAVGDRAGVGRWRPCAGRALATVREELVVGTVGGSGTFSATRVASWTRHVAIACAKGIAKINTYYYSPAYLRACVLVCLPTYSQ